MKIQKRILKLEKVLGTTKPEEWHTVVVRLGQTAEEQVEKYKTENAVGPDALFWIIQVVAPDPGRWK